MFTAVRSLDIDFIEPIGETTIQTKKHKKEGKEKKDVAWSSCTTNKGSEEST